VNDYWQTPYQFLQQGGGDCEDFAIMKYMLLRELGWKREDMRIVVLNDTKKKTLHSVLAISLNGKAYILDNQTNIIYETKAIRHYAMIYSINELAWWRHSSSIRS